MPPQYYDIDFLVASSALCRGRPRKEKISNSGTYANCYHDPAVVGHEQKP